VGKAFHHHWVPGTGVITGRVSGECCVGDTLTMADCCLVPQVYNALRFSVDMSQFPIITRLEAALSQRPEMISAHPSKQPDCPPDLR